MIDQTIIFISAVFVLAGFVKGVIGLGLPTVAMGLLAITMPPVEAAAILVLPSFVTNAWQMLAGPSLTGVIRRLWPMMVGICIGTWAGLGLMTGAAGGYATSILGVALAVYAISGLAALRLPAPKQWEGGLSTLVGAITGIISAATGVFVIPAVPYLQAIGFETEELVQALGLSFTVSTLALTVNVAAAGAIQPAMAAGAGIALGMACLGMWAGQALRRRLAPNVFRRWFFVGLLGLGVYLVAKSLI